MKTLILDGSHANDSQVADIKNALRRHLPDAETIILREQKIGNCAGDFFCWGATLACATRTTITASSPGRS